VEILVVDNDPEGSARPIAEGTGSARVRYVLEPAPGIASARNRVLDEAADSACVVFIDDDERPHAGWLAGLLETWQSFGADAVAGPVVSSFSGRLDPWVQAGGFFQRARVPTGTPLTVAATNNLLLDVAAVRRTGVRFDPGFGLSGGSDSLFTRQLTRAGVRMVWCDEAVVTDVVPAARMTRAWVLRRRFRFGNATTRIQLVLAPSARAQLLARASAVGSGSARLAAGAARWLLGALTGSVVHRARGLKTAARGAGMLAGVTGTVYLEYGRGARPRRVPQSRARR
jgi:hypothetical protein